MTEQITIKLNKEKFAGILDSIPIPGHSRSEKVAKIIHHMGLVFTKKNKAQRERLILKILKRYYG